MLNVLNGIKKFDFFILRDKVFSPEMEIYSIGSARVMVVRKIGMLPFSFQKLKNS